MIREARTETVPGACVYEERHPRPGFREFKGVGDDGLTFFRYEKLAAEWDDADDAFVGSQVVRYLARRRRRLTLVSLPV